MNHKGAFALAGAGVATVAWLVGTPASAQELLPIEVSPPGGPPGTVMTISGEGCIGEAAPGVVIVDLFFGEQEDPVLEFPTTSDEMADDGSWSTGIIFEDTDPPGLYDVTATCVVDLESFEVIAEYEFATFELTAPQTPTTPTTAPPSTTPVTPAPAPTPTAQPATPVVAQPTFTG
jgi:hypothetical protein